MYALHPKFAQSPEQFIRAFLLLQKDLHELFDFVEPSEQNLGCYSYRIHELLLRACVEVEANCKAILGENGYPKAASDLTMNDYSKLETTHRLSRYRVRVPIWHGAGADRQPFHQWSQGKSLAWYQAYNRTKHDRHAAFQDATFEHLVDAVCGLVALLSAQFHTHDFAPSDWALTVGGLNDGMESAIGGYFRVAFPSDWPADDRYEFDWKAIKDEPDPFQELTFP
jgi:hypothetical protein